jgi:hypothetical protein
MFEQTTLNVVGRASKIHSASFDAWRRWFSLRLRGACP